MGSWGAPWASGRGCQAAQSSSLGMGGWSEEGRPEFTGVSCPEEGIILWLVEIHGAFSWRDLAVLLIKECYVSTPSARHNLLIIDDLGSTEMLVVLKCVHMDLQSLQAPYLTFTFIVIQAFCSFFFPHLVLGWFLYLLGDPTAGACHAFLFGQGQLGTQPGADRMEVPSAGPGIICGSVSPHIRQHWVAAALAQGEACSLCLPPLEGRISLMGMEAVVPLQFLHQDLPAQEPGCSSHSTEQMPFSYPPVDNRLCLHGFKTCATAREIGKNIYLCWHAHKKKNLLGIIVMIWLPLSSCMVFLFCVSFFVYN